VDDFVDGEIPDNQPQIDLTRSGAGEEEEEVEFEGRARALKVLPTSAWEKQGVGLLRVLRHRDSGRSRVLLRADPSGKVILNTALVRQVDYALRDNSVQFLVLKPSQPPERWAVRVRDGKIAAELSATMERCKEL